MRNPALFTAMAYLSMAIGLHLLHNAWIAFALYHGWIFVTILNSKEFFLRRELFQGLGWKTGMGAVLFGAGGGLVLYLLSPLAGVDGSTLSPILQSLGLTGSSWLLFVFYHSLVNPFFEEIFWRGLLGSDQPRPVLNDFLFAGYHLLVLVFFLDWPFVLLAFAILVLAGWLWRRMKVFSQGLLLPIISHLAADSSIMAVIYLLTTRETLQ